MFRKYLFIVLAGLGSLLVGVSCENRRTESQDTSGEGTESTGTGSLTGQILKDSTNAELYFERASLYIQKKKIDSAYRDLNKAISLDPEDARFFVALSDIYLMQGKISSCKEALEKAISLEAQNKEAYLKLAELNLMLQDYDATFENLKKSLEIDEYNPVAYFISAYAFLELEDTARAIENFQRAVDQKQDYYDAYIFLGNIFAARLDRLAEDYYNNALNVKPQSVEAHYNLALYYQNTEQIENALKTYNLLLRIDPDYIYAHYNMGYINLVYEKDFEKAIRFFTQTIERDQKYFEAYYNRGYSHELMGNYNEARWDYQKTLELKTNYSKAIEGLNRLDRLQQRTR
jgi:tetratricopeptide (TPR) repeat protein